MAHENACWNFSLLLNYPKDPSGISESDWSIMNQEAIEKAFKKIGKKYIFQLERGLEENRLHFQGYVNLKKKIRLSQLINMKLIPGVHWSVAHAPEQLALYCMKDDTRVSGPWADKDLYMGEDLYKIPYPWQKQLEDIVKSNADKRTIHWIYDPDGNSGKTEFAKKMAFTQGAMPLSFAKTTDLLHMASQNPKKAYIFNLTRCKPYDIANGDLYAAMESIKDGMIVSPKYDGKVVLFRPPHVIVLSNKLPKFECLSKDRWSVWTMKPDRTLQKFQ